MEDCFSERKLIGDDFDSQQIANWYRAEKEGYSSLVGGRPDKYEYKSHSLNQYFGFRHIRPGRFGSALGFGAAYGAELAPVIDRLESVTIVEPSEHLRAETIGTLQPRYVSPEMSGELPFEAEAFDLITCIGVLHHIPNVAFVTSELLRVLAKGGYLLLKEPIRTMGDWREPRKGLTKNERGIWAGYFDQIFRDEGVEIVSRKYCDSLWLNRQISKMGLLRYNSILYQRWDSLLSRLFAWNVHYHPKNVWQKIGPGALFYVVRRRNTVTMAKSNNNIVTGRSVDS